MLTAVAVPAKEPVPVTSVVSASALELDAICPVPDTVVVVPDILATVAEDVTPDVALIVATDCVDAVADVMLSVADSGCEQLSSRLHRVHESVSRKSTRSHSAGASSNTRLRAPELSLQKNLKSSCCSPLSPIVQLLARLGTPLEALNACT